jgi:Transglycosylase SLT domain
MRPKSAIRFASCLAPVVVLMLPATTQSREDPSVLCVDAASKAATRTGVPYDVLMAIALVETGRDEKPWPWTVNQGGDGRWFDTVEEAEAHVSRAVEEGVTNVDLGCFQLNFRWHATGFTSIADMLDPDQNATYAARFLSAHFDQTGDWADAAAAYHSATPEYAAVYREKFETAYARMGGWIIPVEPPPEESAPEPDRENRFPLLLAGAAGSRGSLVPTTGGGGRLIGGP